MAIARCQNCGKPEGRRQTYVSRAFVPQSLGCALYHGFPPYPILGSGLF
jgi:hypothetical protein